MRARLGLLAIGLSLTACRHENMYTQPKAVTYGNSNFFPRHMVMRHPVPGTVAINAPDAPVPQPKAITAAILARGRQGYNVNCVPCHDYAGSGHGVIVSRGYPQPPKLYSARIRHFTARRIFDIITYSKNGIHGFGDLLEPAERWDIVAYVRALQLSQHARIASLPAPDQARLATYSLPATFNPGSGAP